MKGQFPRHSPTTGIKLRAVTLEERWLPSQTPMGPIARPYTSTEVMAMIRSQDPLADLRHVSAVGLDAASSRVIFHNGESALVEVRLSAGTNPESAVSALNSLPNVTWAEPNYVFIGDPREFTPDDPSFASQYHHPLMQNNKAWDIQTGNPAIIVAILDDGFSTAHPDLSPDAWINSKEIAGNTIDDDLNGFADDVFGWDFNAGDNNVNPGGADTHGTHVAGITAARTNNTTGVSGVAGGGPNGDGVRIMPIRWYDSVTWTASMVAQSYTYAANNGAKIANASYNFDGWASGGVQNATVASGLDYAYSKGMLLFNSAGNSGALDPARQIFDQVLFVSSSDASDVKSSFSNYGAFVDIDAPGSSILATTTNTNGTVFTYGTLSGTSMSTPNAAGAAALIWSQNPSWNRDQVAAQLLNTADNIDAANPLYVGKLGTGRANTHRALTETLPPPKLGTITGLPANNGTIPLMPASFTVNAPMRFDPATVNGAKFELRSDGLDNMFDTGDDVVLPMTLNNGGKYTVGVGQFSFAINSGGGPERYRFKASAALLDPFGQALDGNSDGTGGDNFTHTFTVSRQIDGYAYEDRNNNGARETGEALLSGRRVYLDMNNNGNFDFTTSNFVSSNVPLPISDFTTTSSTLSVSGLKGVVTDVNVKFSLTHTFDGDLSAYLVGPTGAKITLFAGVGGAGDNFTNTVLDDQAASAISAGVAPFTGSFRPTSLLAAFNSLDPNGTWTLQIADDFSGDVGTLDSWSLEVTENAEPNTTTDLTGLYYFNGLAGGMYSVRHDSPTGWNSGLGPVGGAYVVTVNSLNDQNPNRDFGELRANAVYGRFYDDANHSGAYNTPETFLANWTAFLDLNGNGTLDAPSNTFTSSNVPLALPDLTEVLSSLSVAGTPGIISDVNVKLSISHTSDAHLDVFLISPTGQKIELFTDVGGTGDNFTNTVLDDQAATAITAGTAPFTGTYRPEGALSGFNGVSANGTWQLSIRDDTTGTTGTLTAWSLTITTTEPTAKSAVDGSYSFINLAPGTHTIHRVLQGGYTATQPTVGSYSVTIVGGETTTNRDFGQTTAPLPPPPRVSQFVIDDGSTQRSMVRSITAKFDQVVTLPVNSADAFTLVGPNGPVTLTVDLSASTGTQTIAKLTFSGSNTEFTSIKDGLYTMTVLSSQVQSPSSQFLDGDNNGVAGGDATVTLHRLFGDSDGDRSVAANDFIAFRLAFGGTGAMFDFDNDGAVAASDFIQFRLRFGGSI